MNRSVIISGCSGGGKSTLLAELKRRGYRVVEEPGRRVVHAEMQSNGTALPWIDMKLFLEKVIEVALNDIADLDSPDNWVFFDRGLIDAAIGLQYLTGKPSLEMLGQGQRYNQRVFMAPPWPEIYVQDQERRHGLDIAMAEYYRLIQAYLSLGYDLILLPKVKVTERAESVLNTLMD